MLQIKKLLESCGEGIQGTRKAARIIEEALNAPDDDAKHIEADDFSLAAIWEAVVGPRLTTLTIEGPMPIVEDVNVHQFTILAKTLISKVVMAAFTDAALVGDKLVTPFKSTLLTDKVPGGFVSGTPEDIEPGMAYPHNGDITEKYVQIEGKKRGHMLDVTWEAIFFDQTGIVLREARKFGRQAAKDREKQIIFRIQDLANFRSYHPSNTQTNIYQAAGAARHTYGNLINNALQNWTDIDAAFQALGAMLDDNGDPILVTPKILLVPRALEVTATRLIKNQRMPAIRTTTGPGDSPNEANPFHNRFEIVATPYLDLDSTVVWYLGDFKAQFLNKVVMPLEVLSRFDEKNDAAWEKDIKIQFKVRYYQRVGAVDYRLVVKSNGTHGQCEHDSICGAGSFS